MTTPEQQPNDPVKPNAGNTAEPGATSDPAPAPTQPSPAPQPARAAQPAPAPQPAQPAYGQYAHPDYGAMRSQYGPNYNPYLYGAPDPDPKPAADGEPATPTVQNPYPYQGYQGRPAGRPAGANRPADGHTPRYIYGVDVNDPAQNPLYGRWDAYAIISFVFAMVFSVPLLPAIMGAASLWRIRTFHMRGYGFAVAAIIVNLITTGVQVWMWMNGVSVTDLYTDLLNMYGGSGDSGDSLNA